MIKVVSMFRLQKARRKIETKKKGKVIETKPSEDFYYVISFNGSIIFPISHWIKTISMGSIRSAKTYGRTSVEFLNFLHKRKVNYWDAHPKDLRDYFISKIEFDKEGNYTGSSNVQKHTIENYKAALTSMYTHLTNFYDNNIITTYEVQENGRSMLIKNKLITTWDEVNIQANNAISISMASFKTTEKEYIKIYTDEELYALFGTLRQVKHRAIFMLTLFGMRIDEVLSIKLKDYDPKNNNVRPSRSKGRKGGAIRYVKISNEAVQLLEAYITHQRKPAEKLALKNNQSCEYLFVNTRLVHEELDFKPYTDASYRSAFIRAAERAGISKNVKTHSGRSHRAIELLRMANEGEIKISDDQIRVLMGWKTMNSAEPYIEIENKRIADNIALEVETKRSDKRKTIARLDELENLKGHKEEK